jgi:23S rRNA (adenine2503-C2)-methyltransferase
MQTADLKSTPEDSVDTVSAFEQIGRVNFYDLRLSELEELLSTSLGYEKYRAKQLFRQVYRNQVTDIEQMTDIGHRYHQELGQLLIFPELEIAKSELSQDGTRKYLIRTTNGELVETVMIKQPTRYTLCVSSQVGCGMGCKFCRTATMGFMRNLKTSEIIGQVLAVAKDAKTRGESFNNIVFMGMGEPLHNLERVVRAVNILTDEHGLQFPPRKITVSTVGLVPAIKKFGISTNVNLAVSLNATTDDVRSRIMPVNKRFPIEQLIDTLKNYPLANKKKITIEYVMLGGLNDTKEDLQRLPSLLHGVKCKVNLIPYNENADLGYSSPKREWVHYWLRELSSKLDVTIRWSKGIDINAACGQLATKEANI